jgi:hypothetical protein
MCINSHMQTSEALFDERCPDDNNRIPYGMAPALAWRYISSEGSAVHMLCFCEWDTGRFLIQYQCLPPFLSIASCSASMRPLF